VDGIHSERKKNAWGQNPQTKEDNGDKDVTRPSSQGSCNQSVGNNAIAIGLAHEILLTNKNA